MSRLLGRRVDFVLGILYDNSIDKAFSVIDGVLKEEMDANGLSIPFPQQDVHLTKSA